MAAAVGFQSTIKPYFTTCYHDHMLNQVPPSVKVDLWDPAAVQAKWTDINSAVSRGSMPLPGCPEGVWNQATRQKFLSDFQAWKDAGYPP
jgi:hypothetical protein